VKEAMKFPEQYTTQFKLLVLAKQTETDCPAGGLEQELEIAVAGNGLPFSV